MSSTGFVCAVEDASGLFPRVLLTVWFTSCAAHSVIGTVTDEVMITGKPTNQGVNQLKYQRSLKSTAEERVGRRCANLASPQLLLDQSRFYIQVL